ncbi:MAG: hypothetical protein AAGA06_09675 [Pseudomonadota bacterium]
MILTKEISEESESSGALTRCLEQTRQALHVCDLLEALADDLPKRVAPVWREVQIQERSFLQPYFEFMNSTVLPTMLRQSDLGVDRSEMLMRLKADCVDRVHAMFDLDELITDALQTDKFDSQPEALGYALRGHFDALRRDLLWQLDVLWPMASRTLSKDDMSIVLSALGTTKTLH